MQQEQLTHHQAQGNTVLGQLIASRTPDRETNKNIDSNLIIEEEKTGKTQIVCVGLAKLGSSPKRQQLPGSSEPDEDS